MPVLYRFDSFMFRRSLFGRFNNFALGPEAFLEAVRSFMAEGPHWMPTTGTQRNSLFDVGVRRCRKARRDPINLAMGILDFADFLEASARDGDKENARRAAEGLVLAASEFAAKATRLALEKPLLFKGFAEFCDEWPTTIWDHSDSDKQNEEIIKTVQLGRETGLTKLSKKASNREKGKKEKEQKQEKRNAALKKYAARLFEAAELAQHYCHYLTASGASERQTLERESVPPLKGQRRIPRLADVVDRAGRLPAYTTAESFSQAQAEKWFAVGWDLWLLVTGGTPTDSTDLGDMKTGELRKQLSRAFMRRFLPVNRRDV